MTPVPSYPVLTLVGVNIKRAASQQRPRPTATGMVGPGDKRHRNCFAGPPPVRRGLDAANTAENAPRGVADAGQPKTGTANPEPSYRRCRPHIGAGGSLKARARLWAPGAYRQPPQDSAMEMRVASSRGNGQQIPNTKEGGMNRSDKNTVEACVGAWLHNKRADDEAVTYKDEALVERLHRVLGTADFRGMIAENRRLQEASWATMEAITTTPEHYSISTDV